MRIRNLFPILTAVLLALALAACGDDSDEGGDGGGTGDGGVATPGAAAAVCDGETLEGAPAYEEGAAQVATFVDSGDGYEFTSYAGTLPEGTTALVPEEASVVVCLEVTDSEVVETCEFEDDDTGEMFTQELADATYEARAVVAGTGEELFSESFSAEAGDCGIIASFQEGEGSRVEYAKPEQELLKALRPITGS